LLFAILQTIAGAALRAAFHSTLLRAPEVQGLVRWAVDMRSTDPFYHSPVSKKKKKMTFILPHKIITYWKNPVIFTNT